MPAVLELATDRQWRVRLSVLEYSPILVKSLDHDIFISELLPAILRWLCDPVFKVREAASEIIAKVATEIGHDAAVQYIVPEIMELARNSNYLYRITALMSISHMPDSLVNEVLPIAVQLVSDPIPNVRYNVAKCLASKKGLHASKIRSSLITLSNDSDIDVRYFAKNVIDSI
jgi:serine/threonine-protein phosphatase 2A regulatory subunit A